LSVQGEVAHEEDIGERAVLDHLQSDGSRSAAPVFDYKMIDGDYLLAPVASAWLVHQARPRAAAFLAAPAGEAGVRGTRGAALVARAPQMASVWRAKAPQLFEVAIPRKQADGAIEAYATSQAIAAQPALAALGPGDLRFHAIALDASGKPIPVMHSDEGFALL